MRYVSIILGALAITGCTSAPKYTYEAYGEKMSALHGHLITEIVEKVGPPTRSFDVYPRGERKLKEYDWIPPGTEVYIGGPPLQPEYHFYGPYCLSTLFVDEDNRVVGHRFQGPYCVAPEKTGPKTEWVYLKTEDVE